MDTAANQRVSTREYALIMAEIPFAAGLLYYFSLTLFLCFYCCTTGVSFFPFTLLNSSLLHESSSQFQIHFQPVIATLPNLNSPSLTL